MSAGRLTPEITPDDHRAGPDDAPVTLVEYGDYECPHCRRAHAIVQYLQRELGDALRYVYRNFPLAQAHPHAQHAAEAAEAVAARGGEAKFWAMHELLFKNQRALADSDLLEYAGSLGVDVDGVAADLESGAMASRVRNDFRSGVRSGVNGTPTFFVNGQRYDGDWTDGELFATELVARARVSSR